MSWTSSSSSSSSGGGGGGGGGGRRADRDLDEDRADVPLAQRVEVARRAAPRTRAPGGTRAAASTVARAPARKRARAESGAARDPNAPVERSAKVRAPPMAAAIPQSRARAEYRDPRFDPLCGELQTHRVAESYRFVGELEEAEAKALRQRAARDPDAARELARLEARADSRRRAEARQTEARTLRREEAERVARGKRAFYEKSGAVRDAARQAEFRELKGAGRLQKVTANRAKRSAASAKKKMPQRRQHDY